jgi:hypothetical protein
MSDDLKFLYAKYVDYVTCLHATLGSQVSPRYRAALLCYDDFCRAWQQWGATEGLQESWRRRFERGYHRVAADLSAKLAAALTAPGRRAATARGRTASTRPRSAAA